MNLESLANSVVIVLVEPQHSGNIGGVARGMKNMGLNQLVLVNPPAYDPEKARWMAPGCAELLSQTRIVATLDEALSDCHWAVATTARHRKHDQRTFEPSSFAETVIRDLEEQRRVAIVFGREDHGLSVDEVSRCEAILWIPTPEHASLNLAQATLVIANTIFETFRAHGGQATGRTLGGSRGSVSTDRMRKRQSKRDQRANLAEMEGVVTELTRLMERIGYTRAVSADKVALSARIGLQKSEPSVRDIHAYRGMIARLNWALSNPDCDWTATKGDKQVLANPTKAETSSSET